MKRILLNLIMLMMTVSMFAVPAHRRSFTVTQSNGEKLTLMMVGDEFMHYYINTATGEKMQLTAKGDYALYPQAEFEAQKAKAQEKMAMVNKERVQRLETFRASNIAQRSLATEDGPKRVGSIGNVIGNKKGLVILVNFQDKAMYSTHTQELYNRMFNEEGFNTENHIGSVSEYFADQSYGQLNIEFDVVGPVTVSQNMSYYGGNDSSGNDTRPATMVIEACKLADAEGINFKDYDWDGDGYVDQVYVIYAGYGENYGASANTIWPHEWTLSSARYSGDGSGRQTIDGVYVDTYACSCELYGTSGYTLSGIGTACHEFSHCLGYPDLYDTDYSGGIGMDNFDVMCGGSYNGPYGRGEVPCGYTAYERWMAGWMEPEVIEGRATITELGPINDDGAAYVIYNEKNPNEYLLLENRQSNRWFRYFGNYTAGHGLFITHVDYNASVWSSNRPNDDKNHQRMTWIAADGKYGTYNSSYGAWTISQSEAQGDFFPGTKNVTALTATSHSSVGGKYFNTTIEGSYDLNHELSEITEENGLISFKVDGGERVDDGTRYTITFDAGPGTTNLTSWTQLDFLQKLMLPTCVSTLDGWIFQGWSETLVDPTEVLPADIMKAGTDYEPERDVTLYAVYRNVRENELKGSYTLDYDNDENVKAALLGYGKVGTYTGPDGEDWLIKAQNNNGVQITRNQSASIKVPVCPAPISTITITQSSSRVLRFSTADYTGYNSPTSPTTSNQSTTATITLTGKDLKTGYIYNTSSATAIRKIVVNYGGGTITTYASRPEPALPTSIGGVAKYIKDLNAGKGKLEDLNKAVDKILEK